jgi:hypothetical protein
MVRFLIPALALATTLMAGCADKSADGKIPEWARAALEKADQFELLSLDPDRRQEKPKDDFHGWKVLGRTQVKDADTRKKLVAALKKGVGANDGAVANCFNPRHGIRAVHEGKTIDFAICFECLQVKAYAEEKREGGFLTTGSPQPVFDQVLREAGVPLAAAAKQ